jgi:hypothetical protein
MTNIPASPPGENRRVERSNIVPTLKASNNSALMLLAFSEPLCRWLKPGDSRRALMFIAFGDFFEFSNSFLKLDFQRRDAKGRESNKKAERENILLSFKSLRLGG